MTVVRQEIITFQPGDIVIKEKSPGTAIYIIKEGQLQAYRERDGKKIPLGIIQSGEYVGEMALFLDSVHSTSVVALTEVKAVKLSKKALETQMKQLPPWFVALTKGLVERLRDVNEILRRNTLVDERVQDAISAIEAKHKPIKKEEAS